MPGRRRDGIGAAVPRSRGKLLGTAHTRRTVGRALYKGTAFALCAAGCWAWGHLAEASGMADSIMPQLPASPGLKVERFDGDKLLVEYYNNDTTMCESWVLVPAENMWDTGLRGVLYFVALVYVLLGIAIISDIFMAGIEKITSAREVAKVDSESGETRTFTVVVWNETVANLTLLALGSSAPEILLAIIETVTTLDSTPGELGASTIVGSAAFNLLCISAVCMWVTEDNKKVNQFGVFVITTIASFFAYAWMCVVLLGMSKCEVTIIEGLLTLLFFPGLVLLAYMQDKQWFSLCSAADEVEKKILSVDDEDSAHRIRELWKRLNADKSIPVEEAEARLAALAEAELGVGFSKAAYRMGAVKVTKKAREDARGRGSLAFHSPLFPDSEAGGPRGGRPTDVPPSTSVLQWASPSFTVLENEGSVLLHISRTGPTDTTVTVKYRTQDGTAIAGRRYEQTSGHVVMEEGQTSAQVKVAIIDDKQYQDDEVFHVVLSDVGSGAVLGHCCCATVTIVDDDIPGLLEFDPNAPDRRQEMEIQDGGRALRITVSESLHQVDLTVLRKIGTDGRVSVHFQTVDGTAHSDVDYVPVSCAIEFTHGEKECTLSIPIINHMEYAKEKFFEFELTSPEKGATLGPLCKGVVTVTEDKGVRELIDRVVGDAEMKRDIVSQKMQTSYGEQFRTALTIEEGDGPISGADYAMHFLTIFWKVLFATVPPTNWFNGWATFTFALMYIAMVTALVAELASLFGCVVGLKDPVTAITLVALGTSLPDTFASMSAIQGEEFADAAIGNVMGSNSVNVFLGLGLPWTIASIYKSAQGETYIYPAGGLVFSVALFLCTALGAIVVMMVNRRLYGGELGGPQRHVFACILLSLWVCLCAVPANSVCAISVCARRYTTGRMVAVPQWHFNQRICVKTVEITSRCDVLQSTIRFTCAQWCNRFHPKIWLSHRPPHRCFIL